jgi:hypothetical protein
VSLSRASQEADALRLLAEDHCKVYIEDSVQATTLRTIHQSILDHDLFRILGVGFGLHFYLP